jgi:hypothetical protein
MTLEALILRDLSVSQSTADSIAGRLNRPTEAIQTILTRLETENKVFHFLILDRLKVYKLLPAP